MEVINLKEKLKGISEHWSPHIAGALNGQLIKLAKVKGDFVFHHHENEDELFLVISGKLFMDFENGETKEINPGEFLIVPKGVSHRPHAIVETEILLFEPNTTLNTGNVINDFTKQNLPKTV